MAEELDLAEIRRRASAGREAAVGLSNTGDILRGLAGTCDDVMRLLASINHMSAEFQAKERNLRAELQAVRAEAEGYKNQWASRGEYVDQLERDMSEMVGHQSSTRQKILDLHLGLKRAGAREWADKAYSIIS